MHALLNIAIRAARKAGDTIVRSLDRLDALAVDSKGRNEYVTEIDVAAERQIQDIIRRAYPSHGFICEESGVTGGDETVWIIDPLDGTTNFIHGFPVFCVSIGVRVKGKLEHGVVYDPLRQELFTASRGGGAQLDGKKIRVANRRSLDGALIGTGFPYRASEDWMDQYFKMLRAISLKAAGIRRPGSAALDLAYVAAGRFDGFWELGLKIWDIAAGELLIREAGGLVGDLEGGEQHRERGDVVAGNPRVFKALLKELSPYAELAQKIDP
jgi:myo-inositol-1(or 4)-monophosphatase